MTRSGANDFHGSLFEYLRNDKFDANNFFANARGLARPPIRQNDFGGVLGGPVRLPKRFFGPRGYDGRNRTFFFFSYEGVRLRTPFVITSEESFQNLQSPTGRFDPRQAFQSSSL